MNQKKILFIASLLLFNIILISGCTKHNQPAYNQSAPVQSPKEMCINLCRISLTNNKNLSNGPCLSDKNPNWAIADWVCDIAHNPRTETDNESANQCTDYRNKKANHFVELDAECRFIREN